MRGAVWITILALAAAALAQAPAPPTPEPPPVPDTPEAAALARETGARLNALSYSLYGSDAPGFVAAYAVLRAGAAPGKITVSWSREGDAMQALFDGDLPAAGRSRLETAMLRALRISICAQWEPEGDRAVLRDGAIVIDGTASCARANRGVKRHVDRIAKDLLSFTHTTWYEDGSEVEEANWYEAAEGRHYLARSRIRARLASGERSETDLDYRYSRPEGRPFVKRVLIAERGTPDAVSAECVLESVEFRIPRPGEGLPEAERLAREFIETANRMNYSLYVHPDLHGFEAVYSIVFSGYEAGRLVCRWNLDTGECVPEYQGQVPEAVRDNFDFGANQSLDRWLSAATRDYLWDALILRFEPGSEYRVRAARRAEDVVLLYEALSATSDTREIILIFRPDGVLVSSERRWRDGGSEVRVHEQEAAEGWWLRRRVRRIVKQAGGGRFAETVDFVYRRVDGAFLPSRIHLRCESGVLGGQNAEIEMTLIEGKVRR